MFHARNDNPAAHALEVFETGFMSEKQLANNPVISNPALKKGDLAKVLEYNRAILIEYAITTERDLPMNLYQCRRDLMADASLTDSAIRSRMLLVLSIAIPLLSEEFNRISATPERQAQSAQVINDLLKDDKDIDDYGNDILRLWERWARPAKFIRGLESTMLASDHGLAGMHLRNIAASTSWSIPTRTVLNYMKSHAPNNKITDLGAGLGYWANLLKNVGVKNVTAVDLFVELPDGPLLFPVQRKDAVATVASGETDDGALFICWARPYNKGGAYVAEVLERYRGNCLFVAGERNHGSTFEFDVWMETVGRFRGWKRKLLTDLPCFSGIRDTFTHYHLDT